jgi:hypothetical protein
MNIVPHTFHFLSNVYNRWLPCLLQDYCSHTNIHRSAAHTLYLDNHLVYIKARNKLISGSVEGSLRGSIEKKQE